MSTFNAGGILGQELGAGLTQALGVSTSAEAGGGTDFSHLFELVLICNLASLLPLFALGLLDEAAPAVLPPSGDDEASSGELVGLVVRAAEEEAGTEESAPEQPRAGGTPPMIDSGNM